MNQPVPGDDPITQTLWAGAALASQGQVREALALFERLLQDWPDEPRALYNAGVMHDLLGERKRALALLARSVTVDPAFAHPYLYGGQIALREGRLTEAQAAFREALARDVTLKSAYEGMAQVAQHQERSLVDRETQVVFYTGGPPFHGSSWQEDGLGGSESALIFLARALADQGYRVRVFCNCDQPGTYDEVCYGDLVDFHIYHHFNHLPLLISSRSLRPFKLSLRAARRILWTHDAPNVRYLQGERIADLPIDRILSVSRWQAKVWSARFGIPLEKFALTRNGVDMDLFTQELPRERHKLVYTSRPDRGLQVLLNLWPRIREEVPEAHLHVFGYRLPDDPGEQPFAVALDQPGIVAGGSLSKPDLARELLSARLLAYPATFKETSCMAAIEAMAAGTPVVASSLAALPETVPDGVAGRIVPDEPHSDEFGRQFVQAVVTLLRDDAAWAELSEGARQHACTHHDWRAIAQEWAIHLELEPSARGNVER